MKLINFYSATKCLILTWLLLAVGNVNAQIIVNVAGTGTNGYTGDGGPATAATFFDWGVTLDAGGNVYFADISHHVIRKITAATGIISTIAGTGVGGFSGDGGAATAAKLNNPAFLVVDGAGNLYITDGANNRIRKINTSGIISTIAGTGAYGFSGDGGPATAALINYPRGLAIDASGTLYFVDGNNNRVRKISAAGIISTIGGNGGIGTFTGDGGPATAAGMDNPWGLAINAANDVYFSDGGNNRVRKISNATGIITTFAGDGFSAGDTTDGGSATAVHISPQGICFDPAGNLYIVDRGSAVVLKVNTAGNFYKIAGVFGSGPYNGDSLAAGSTTLSGPNGIAYAANGYIYIADGWNYRMRKILCKPIVPAIAGASSVCVNAATTFTNAATDGVGTWSSSAPAVASISSTGVVSGIAAGTATITYSVTNSCNTTAVTKTITVNSGVSVAPISGSASICVAASATLTDATTGGTWTSSAPTIATVNASGVVTGVATGTAVITYSVVNLCGTYTATKVIRIGTPLVAGVAGTNVGCAGAGTFTHTCSTPGGIWSISAPSVATINASGVITGLSQGNAYTTYTVSNSCGSAYSLGVAVINIPVSPIVGASTACLGSTITFTNATNSGSSYTWSSTNPTVGTVTVIDQNTSRFTGAAVGTTTISYTINNSCGATTATKTVTVSGSPTIAAISGATSVCVAATTTFTNATTGGIWSSSAPTIASVSATGVVRGNAVGTAIISYAVTGSCGTTVVTQPVTINSTATVAAISGASTVCIGSPISLTDTTTGGTWTSSAPTIATVSASGVVTGITAGSATITYSVAGGCGAGTAVKAITVSALPVVAAVGGASSACIAVATFLTDATTGGSWTSSAPAIATVNASGVVTGSALGSTTISYSVTNTCGTSSATRSMTITGAPVVAAIGGAVSVCLAATTSLSDATTGGTWSSSTPSIASVSSTGAVRGNAIGTAIISYGVTNTCGTTYASQSVTVNTTPVVAAISGAATVCAAGSTSLANATTGGTWTTSAGTIASVSASGIVTGIAAGSATISYSVTSACGTAVATKAITVTAAPVVALISGTTSFCAGTSTSFTDATTGGTWSSSTPAVATISAAGIATGVAAGSAVITYAVTNTCGTTTMVKGITVNGLPTAAPIAGATTVCLAATTSLTDATTGGTWSSSAASVASVSTAGVVRGNTAGSATISYSVTGTCGTSVVTAPITVLTTVVPAIAGISSVNVGAAVTMTNTTTGGTWTTSAPAIATINSSGVVTGIAAGTATITYTVANSCGTGSATFAVTVTSATGPVYISSIAGSGTSGYSGDGGAASSANLSYPYAVAVSTSGIIYIADQVNNRIRKVTAAGVITTFAGNGAAGNTGDGGAATTATLNNPIGVAVDASGNVYIADYGNSRIRKVNAAGIISNFAGSGVGLDGGAATAADLYHPSGVAVDPSGNVYIAETGNNRIRKVNTSGIISSVAGNGVSGFSGDGAAATLAKLSSPVGVCTDAYGNICIADMGNHRIRKVNASGIITTVAGTGALGFSGDGGLATAAAINTPYGMTIDGFGNIYICDYGNYRVRKVSTTGIMSTFAGNGSVGFSGDGGLATAAMLNRPTGIAVDASGNVYEADINNQRIRKFAACILPVSGIISGPSTVIIGNNITLATTGTGGTWSSVFTAKATVAASGMVHAIASGIDTIKYTVTNTCGTTSSVYVVSITSSKPAENTVAATTTPTTIRVYPNPSTGVLNIETDQDDAISNVLVFDLSGKMMQQVSASGNNLQVDISNYAAGVYIFRVLHTNGQVSQVRIVKE
ncbi:hypothetical protein CJD36_005015 [Flavipsychrobacter stenotrophus]|uniref:BIG2 domain-containing protein n=1 Tax=Flavipsychrobacter stenotrophus TaxID=2077091 RepID=A0A2S7T2S6_9BACT|nr:Ig-like domain-containing protein [Flavipsychrobacter stenotrophus]PQJ13105.1 hypothetical protein CJD36_005015 [Flavipsychrobacter stenotrophus]